MSEQDSLYEHRPPSLSLSRERIAALVYVGIALFAVAIVSSETYGTVQWFSAVNNLDFSSSTPVLHLDNQSLGYPFVLVQATLKNPTGYSSIYVTFVTLTVYVASEGNDTSFQVAGSPEVAQTGFSIGQSLGSQKSLNASQVVPLFTDVLSSLKGFLSNHPSDAVTFVQAEVHMSSIYGPFSNTYCYSYPGDALTVCPPPRAPPSCTGSLACGGG